VNWDLIPILDFVAKSSGRIRIIRRATGLLAPSIPHLPEFVRNEPIHGESFGGKAANLNAALRALAPGWRWALILDADSLVTSDVLKQFARIAVSAGNAGIRVGFIQGALWSCDPGDSVLERALCLSEDVYYRQYAWLKIVSGVIPNWGHGMLVSRDAWESTNGFPLEISEDLAWANCLAVDGGFVNYYTTVATLEAKPVS